MRFLQVYSSAKPGVPPVIKGRFGLNVPVVDTERMIRFLAHARATASGEASQPPASGEP